MGIIKRQGIKYSFISYIGVILGAINILIIYPFALEPDELGLARFVLDTSLFIAPFFLLGLDQIGQKFYPEFKDKESGDRGLLGFMLLVGIFGFVLCVLIAILFGDWLGEYYNKQSPLFNGRLFYMIPIIGLVLLMKIFYTQCINYKRITIPALFIIWYIKISLPILALLYYYSYISIDTILWGIVISYLLVVISLVVYTNSLQKLKFKIYKSYFPRKKIKEMGVYGLYAMLGSTGTLIATRLDAIMLASIDTGALTSSGIYTIPLFISSGIAIPTGAIFAISGPIISEAWSKNNLTSIQNYYSKTSLNLIIFGVLALMLVWLSVDELYAIMPNGEKFVAGKYAVLILGITKLIDMATGINQHIIAFSAFFRFNFYALMFLAVLNIVSNYIFIPIYHINGAALATLFSLTVYNVIKFVFIYVKFGMQPFSIQSIKVLILGLLVYFLVCFVPNTGNPFVDTFINSLLAGSLYVFSILALKISPDLNVLFKQIIKRIKP